MTRRWLRRALAALAGLCLLSALAWLALPKCDLYPEGITWSREVRDRSGTLLHLTLSVDEKYRLFVPLSGMQPDVIEATLLHEDRHYWQHPGVNPMSTVRAAGGWMTGMRRGGGSTITMQYARLRWRLNTRSAWGKIGQMARALQLERHYTKAQILEAYLNLAPYGGNVEGVGAAGLLWCGKRQSDLTLRESAALSVLPQSPARRKPVLEGDNPALAKAQAPLVRELRAIRGLTNDPLQADFSLRVQRAAPRAIPHLSRRLLAEHPNERTIATTIDAPRQAAMEAAIADYLDRKREIGVNNACAMLVHAPTREVVGYAGSAEFLDRTIQGQVDGVLARRSPGSALKPFIYALALDQGLIHPRTLLNDAKVSFGDYNPENFDRGFAGPIPAVEALSRSRNIPAVALTQKLARPGLYGFIKHAGVELPASESHYGLALPLGGAEVTMEELAGLYVLLANDGKPGRLRYLSSEQRDQASAPALLSPAACYLTREMLRQGETDDGLGDPRVSWKTGTSHGFRDAWAAGIRGDYVLVVWIGNFNGKANPAFVARECAAPLLFEMFRRLMLPYRAAPPPRELVDVELCAVSGQLPTPLCAHRVHGGFIPGVSPIQPCQIHQEIWMDGTSGLRIPANDGRAGIRREVYECWPPDQLALFKQAGLPRREPPAFEATLKVPDLDNGHLPRITSPRAALTYHVRASQGGSGGIPLEAEAAPGVKRVYWFAGTRFIGSCAPAEPLLWQSSAGRWTLHVLDDHGRASACDVRVEAVP